MKEKNTPEVKFRAGPISATVWKNTGEYEGKPSEYRTVSFERNYKDKKTDEWKTTNSLRTMDLPKAVVVLNKAFEHIIMNNADTAKV